MPPPPAPPPPSALPSGEDPQAARSPKRTKRSGTSDRVIVPLSAWRDLLHTDTSSGDDLARAARAPAAIGARKAAVRVDARDLRANELGVGGAVSLHERANAGRLRLAVSVAFARGRKALTHGAS